MPLPVTAKNKRLMAVRVFNMLDNIDRRAKATLLSMAQSDLINLYYVILRASATLSEMAADGYTAEVLGPVMGEEYAFDWTVYGSEYDDLKNTKLPGFIAAFQANKTAILARDMGLSNVEPVALDQNTIDALTPSLQAVSDSFAAV